MISSPVKPPKGLRSSQLIDPLAPLTQKIFRVEGVTANGFINMITVKNFRWFRIVAFHALTSNIALQIAEYGMSIYEGELVAPVTDPTVGGFDRLAYHNDWGYPDPSGNAGIWMFQGVEFGPTVLDLTASFRPALYISGAYGAFYVPIPKRTFFGPHTIQIGPGAIAWSAQLNALKSMVVVEGVTEDNA